MIELADRDALSLALVLRGRSVDLVITGGSRSSGGLRRLIAQTLAEGDGPMLVAGRPRLDQGLVVIDDELSPPLVDLLRREPFRRARLRVLGVADASAPW